MGHRSFISLKTEDPASASLPLVPATISHKVNAQNNIHGKFPSSGEPVTNNSGAARRAGWFLLQNPIPPTPQSFP